MSGKTAVADAGPADRTMIIFRGSSRRGQQTSSITAYTHNDDRQQLDHPRGIFFLPSETGLSRANFLEQYDKCSDDYVQSFLTATGVKAKSHLVLLGYAAAFQRSLKSAQASERDRQVMEGSIRNYFDQVKSGTLLVGQAETAAKLHQSTRGPERR